MSAKQRIETSDAPSLERVSILLPVLNEAPRIVSCLETLITQPEEAWEILVIDGGSTDGTQAIVEAITQRDARVRLIDASPIDPQWTGKAWGLYRGLHQSQPESTAILCVDADVRAEPRLVRSLIAHAKRTGVNSFSVATAQHLSGWADGLLHPALLTTLIYRFGSPGSATRQRHKVHANGQCFFSRRDVLIRTQAFNAAQRSLCEDITIVRRLAECGEAVGFYESDHLVGVQMYSHWRETWNNWPRSLPMRDQYFGWREIWALAMLLPLQALPLPILIVGTACGAPIWLLGVAALLFAIRLGVLFGTARAYPNRPWSYWFSPLCDLPVVLRVLQNACMRRHRWRGRTYVRRKGGSFEPV